MSTSHLETAYWAVLKTLAIPTDNPEASLRAALPEFLATANNSSKAGEVLARCLQNSGWDWPLWTAYAKKADRDSIQDIRSSVTKMRPAEILDALTTDEVKKLCEERGLEVGARLTKGKAIGVLLKSVNKDDLETLLAPVREGIQETLSQKCRKQMSLYLAARICHVAYCMDRYEQLNAPELLGLSPYWRFVWGGATDPDAPKACRKFNNKKLHCQQARENFPALPCEYLQCGCYLVAESSGKSS